MSLDYINLKKIRKSFGKIPLVTSLPNLVEEKDIGVYINENNLYYRR